MPADTEKGKGPTKTRQRKRQGADKDKAAKKARRRQRQGSEKGKAPKTERDMKMERKTFAVGNIRPPFHASSLLLRWTENCPWNKCNFCTLYRGGSFRIRTVEEIKQDIDAVAYYRDLILERLKSQDAYSVKRMGDISPSVSREEKRCYSMILNWIVNDNMETVFLQDANTMIMRKDELCEALRYLREKLPSLRTVACYGRADTLSRLSLEDFRDIREAGLTMLHSGFESGCDDVLKLLNKGSTRTQQIDCGQKIKEAGIEYNVFYMPGSGGKALSERNALETADVVNKINPEFLRIRTFVVKPGSPMWDIANGDAAAGKKFAPGGSAADRETSEANGSAADRQIAFEECSDVEKVREIRTFINALEGIDTYVISDHIINLLPQLAGFVNKDKQKMTDYIDGFLSLPDNKQKEFQLARRMCANVDYMEMELMPEKYMEQIRSVIHKADIPEKWEETLRYYLRKYI